MRASKQVRSGAAIYWTIVTVFMALAFIFAQPGSAQAQWATNGNNISNTNPGNVGIGTTTPGEKLVVSGNAANPPAGQDGTILHLVNTDSVKTRITVDSFGLGAAPSVTFRAARGTAAAPAATQSGDAIGIMYGTGYGTTQFLTAPKPAMWMVATENWTDAAAGSAIYFNTVQNGTNVTTERMRINHDGNVGIGTAAPMAPLQVGGYTTINNPSAPTYSQFINNAYFSGGWKYLNSDAASVLQIKDGLSFLTAPAGTAGAALTMTERMHIDNNGNIGLGTTTPGILNGVNYSNSVPLHIQGTTGRFIVIDSSTSNAGIAFNDSSQPVDNRIWAISQVAGSGKLTFSTYTDAGTNSNKFVIDRSGNVGVGTMAPASKLHVAGNITVDGNINAKYQDVAEWVPARRMMPAGTVVVLDPDKTNQVMSSVKAYDTGVAGVISERPGLALGESGEGKVLVATTGRVKVKVDAMREAIRVGDLLVTGEQEGVAMKSLPLDLGGTPIHRPGTLIGKALEPMEKGKTGEILVLLSLQ
ncbi:MAG TPA: hypothetical protein VGO91_15020 [Pyrinomonadaceae bacterium]|jgi:hypothetical protein|nr:hypothetical protein [Pyrinomonadaceae bacterium]